MNRRGGWILADAAFGLLLLAGLGAMTSTMIHRHHRGAADLHAQRDAAEQAQRILWQVQQGRPVNLALEPATRIERLERDRLFGSHQWVRVSVEREGRLAELVGLAPQGALPPP
jgi:hypothetical protein